MILSLMCWLYSLLILLSIEYINCMLYNKLLSQYQLILIPFKSIPHRLIQSLDRHVHLHHLYQHYSCNCTSCLFGLYCHCRFCNYFFFFYIRAWIWCPFNLIYCKYHLLNKIFCIKYSITHCNPSIPSTIKAFIWY